MEDSMQMADLNSMKRVCPNIQSSSIPPLFDLFVIWLMTYNLTRLALDGLFCNALVLFHPYLLVFRSQFYLSLALL